MYEGSPIPYALLFFNWNSSAWVPSSSYPFFEFIFPTPHHKLFLKMTAQAVISFLAEHTDEPWDTIPKKEWEELAAFKPKDTLYSNKELEMPSKHEKKKKLDESPSYYMDTGRFQDIHEWLLSLDSDAILNSGKKELIRRFILYSRMFDVYDDAKKNSTSFLNLDEDDDAYEDYTDQPWVRRMAVPKKFIQDTDPAWVKRLINNISSRNMTNVELRKIENQCDEHGISIRHIPYEYIDPEELEMCMDAAIVYLLESPL